jgi:hypothetical protein
MVFSFAYILFVIIAFQAMGPVMFPVGIVAFTYMLILTSCAYEDKNNSYVMLASLPIKRSHIVLSKYISALVFLIMGVVAYAIMMQVIIILKIPLKTYPITVESLLGAIVAFSLLNALYFPIFFKVGYTKSRIVNFILFFAFFFGINLSVSFIYQSKDKEWFIEIQKIFSNQPDGIIALSFLGVAALLLIISYMISVKIFKNREF